MGVNELLSVVLSGGGRRETGKPTCSTTCETLGHHDLICIIVGALTTQALFWQHVGTPFKGWRATLPPIPSLLLSSFWSTFKRGSLVPRVNHRPFQATAFTQRYKSNHGDLVYLFIGSLDRASVANTLGSNPCVEHTQNR